MTMVIIVGCIQSTPFRVIETLPLPIWTNLRIREATELVESYKHDSVWFKSPHSSPRPSMEPA